MSIGQGQPPAPIPLPYYRPSQSVVTGMTERHERSREAQADFTPVKFTKPSSGINLYRILPPWDETGEFGAIEADHWDLPNVFSKKGGKRPLRCLRMWPELGIECPICGLLDRMGTRVQEEALRKYRPRERARVNVIDRNEQFRSGKVEVLVLDITVATYASICAMMSDPIFFDALHPVEGCDVEINRTGQGLDTRYSARFLTLTVPGGDPSHPSPQKGPILHSPQGHPVSMEAIADLLKQTPNLKKMFRAPYDTELPEYWEATDRLREMLVNQFQIPASECPPIAYPFANGVPATVKKDERKKSGDGAGRMDAPPAGGGYTPPAAPPTTVAPPAQAAPPPVAPPVAPPPIGFVPPVAPPAQAAPGVYVPPGPVTMAPPVTTPPPAPVTMIPPVQTPPPAPTTVAPPAPVAAPTAQPTAPVAPPATMPTPPAEVSLNGQAAAAMQEVQNSPLMAAGEKPSCYGGQARGGQPHADGTFGYQVGSEKCSSCMYEPDCAQEA